MGNSIVRASQSYGTTTSEGANTSDPFDSIAQSISDNVGSGHINLAIGNTVQAAGEVVFRGGQIKSINNASGHFQPFGPAARDAAIIGFNNAGFTQNNLSELYIEAYRRSALGQ